MPHFENLDKYESTHPKTGKKEIIPIAPNSLNSSNYQPVRRPEPKAQLLPKIKEVADVEVEHVSIKQMEKEFRQASRAAGDSVGFIPLKSIFASIKKFLKNLFSGKKKTKRAKVALGDRKPFDRNQPRKQYRTGDRPKNRPDGNRHRGPKSEDSSKISNSNHPSGDRNNRRPKRPRKSNPQSGTAENPNTKVEFAQTQTASVSSGSPDSRPDNRQGNSNRRRRNRKRSNPPNNPNNRKPPEA